MTGDDLAVYEPDLVDASPDPDLTIQDGFDLVEIGGSDSYVLKLSNSGDEVYSGDLTASFNSNSDSFSASDTVSLGPGETRLLDVNVTALEEGTQYSEELLPDEWNLEVPTGLEQDVGVEFDMANVPTVSDSYSVEDFIEPLIDKFDNPPQSTGGLDPTLYEDLNGDGDGLSVEQTVDVFGEIIRGRVDLTDEQAKYLNRASETPDGELWAKDMMALFGNQIRTD